MNPEQRNPSAIISLQSKFPTHHTTVQTSSNIRVCGLSVLHQGLPLLHWVLSPPLGGLFIFSSLRLQLLLTIISSLSSGLNWLWGLLLLN